MRLLATLQIIHLCLSIHLNPSQLRVNPIGDTWAVVSWPPDSNLSVVQEYMVTYGKDGPFDAKFLVPVTYAQPYYVKLDNLNPDTVYHVNVQPIDLRGNAYIGTQEQFRTLQQEYKPDPPVNLGVSTRSSDYMIVNWFHDSDFLDSVIVEYRIKSPDDSMAFIEKRVKGYRNQTILSDLESNTIYEIRSAVTKAGRQSDWSLILEASTLPIARSQFAPTRVIVIPDNHDPTVAWVQWSHGSHRNRDVFSSIQYVVLYTPTIDDFDDDEIDDYPDMDLIRSMDKPGSTVALWYKHLVYPTGDNRTALRNLKPRTLYRIKVMARNAYVGRDNHQAVSDTILYRTPDKVEKVYPSLFSSRKMYWSAAWMVAFSVVATSFIITLVIWEKRRRMRKNKPQGVNKPSGIINHDISRNRSDSFRSSFLLLMQSPEPSDLTHHNMNDIRSGGSFVRKTIRGGSDPRRHGEMDASNASSSNTDFDQRQHLCTFTSSTFQPPVSQQPDRQYCYNQGSSCSTSSNANLINSQPPAPPMRQRFA